MASEAEREKVVKLGLKDLHEGNPDRDGFTHDEIALSALGHYDRYTKWHNRASAILGKVGISLGEKPTWVPSAFKMPTVSDGLRILRENNELEQRHTGDIRTSTTKKGEVRQELSRSTIVYNLTPEALAKLSDESNPEAASQDGNGTGPDGGVQEFEDASGVYAGGPGGPRSRLAPETTSPEDAAVFRPARVLHHPFDPPMM